MDSFVSIKMAAAGSIECLTHANEPHNDLLY